LQGCSRRGSCSNAFAVRKCMRIGGEVDVQRTREQNLATARKLLAARMPQEMSEEPATSVAAPDALANPCPCCGGRMIVIETFDAGCQPRYAPTLRIDTS
jgi:hypothetical protein